MSDENEPLNLDALSQLSEKETPEEAIRWALADRSVIEMLAAVEMAEFQFAMLLLRDRGAKATEVERLEKAVAERRREQRREERDQPPEEVEELDPLEQAAASIGAEDRRIEDLDSTLTLVAAFLKRFVWFPDEYQAYALALWVMHTYCIDAAEITPRISVRAPTRGCGKSRLLEAMKLLVLTPEYQITPTAAVAFRLLGSGTPITLLIDEIDTVYGPKAAGNEDLRGVIDAGHGRGATVARCQGDEHKIVRFPVFGPLAMGGIGRLPGTIEDRCIVIELAKKGRDVMIERFRQRNKILRREAEELRGLLAAWAKRHVESLVDANPPLPEALSDRQQDGWEPLLAIADAAGGDWPRLARAASVSLAGAAAEDDTDEAAVIAAVRGIFAAERYPEMMKVNDLVRGLNNLEDEAWSGWHRGAGYKAYDLRRHLGAFGLKSRRARIGDKNPWGYWLADLQPVWERYLDDVDVTDSGEQTGTPENNGACTGGAPVHRYTAGQSTFLPGSDSNSNGAKSVPDQDCTGVPVVEPVQDREIPGGTDDGHEEWWK